MKNNFIIYLVLTIEFLLTINNISIAGEGAAPEIPTGFAPVVVTGLAFSAAAIKNYFDKKKK